MINNFRIERLKFNGPITKAVQRIAWNVTQLVIHYEISEMVMGNFVVVMVI